MSERQPERVLASVERISNRVKHENADSLDLYSVLGWTVVDTRDKYKVDELVLFFRPDAVLEIECPHFEFLKGKPLETRKIRGELSDGLIGSLEWARYYGLDPSALEEGQDLTASLRVTKRENEGEESGNARKLPWNIPKTSETRVQDCPRLLREMVGKRVWGTRKEDGCSATYAHNRGEFKRCSRSRELTDETRDDASAKHFFAIETSLDIENKLRKAGLNIAVQGEICGPKINFNHHKLDRLVFRVFKVWDIDEAYYWSRSRTEEFAALHGFDVAPVVFDEENFPADEANVKALIARASKVTYGEGVNGEGLVLLLCDERAITQSFKAISPEYVIKHNRSSSGKKAKAE